MLITIWNEIKSKYYCYLHKRKDGRIFYVGKGTYERALCLKSNSRNKWHGRVVTKEGKDNIIIELIPANDEEDANRLEVLYIAFLRPYFELCNLTNGGEGCSGFKPTQETKNKISVSLSGKNNPNYGKSLSEERKSAISKANSGENNPMFGKIGELSPTFRSHRTEEQKQLLSKANSGENNPNYGKIASPETRKKMSKKQSGENNPMFGKCHTEETKKLMSKARLGIPRSDEVKLKISMTKIGQKRGPYKKSIINTCEGKEK